MYKQNEECKFEGERVGKQPFSYKRVLRDRLSRKKERQTPKTMGKFKRETRNYSFDYQISSQKHI